ncbi:MAG: hypothetical protein ABIQ39_12235 [Ilumatobacteraceae bacterium]
MNASAGNAPRVKQPVDWNRRLIVVAVGLILLILGWLFAATFLPRWWSHRVGSQVGGSFAGGVWWGLFYGVIFTLLPLIVARQAFRRGNSRTIRRRWQTRVLIVAAALLLALPNLMTLGIVWGSGNAAHAGERVLDVEAPAFRGAALIGAIGAVVAAVGLQYIVSTRRSRGRELDRLRDEQRRR